MDMTLKQKRLGNIFPISLLILVFSYPFSAWSEDYCPSPAEIEQAKKSKDTDLLDDWLLHAMRGVDKDSGPSCVSQLLSAGASPNLKLWDAPLLYIAINAKNTGLAKALVMGGADVNLKLWGSSVLPRLVDLGDFELVKQALAKGAKLTEDVGSQAMEYAIQNGRLDIVKFLVGKGVDPKIKFEGEVASLFVAAASGNAEVFHYFLGLGFPINNKLLDKGKASLIHAAAAGGNVEIIKELIQKGVNPNLAGKGGYTPLAEAVKAGKTDAVRFFIKNGSYGKQIRNDQDLVQSAVSNGSLDMLKALLEAGASLDFNSKRTVQSFNNAVHGKVPQLLELIKYGVDHGLDPEKLAIAAIVESNLALMKQLRAQGVDFKKNLDGMDAFSRALSSHASTELFEYLVSLGVKMDASGSESPFSRALANGDLKAARIFAKIAGLEKAQNKEALLIRLAGVDSPDDVLLMAANSRNLDLMRFLMEQGLAFKKDDEKMPSILEGAFRSGDRSMSDLLFKQGAEIPKGKEARKQLLSAAAQSGQLKMLKFLEGKGLQVVEMGKEKDDLLFAAVNAGNLDLIKYLVAKGCDPKRKNTDGQSVLYNVPCVQNQQDVIKFFIEKGVNINEDNPALEDTGPLQRIVSCFTTDLSLLKYLKSHGVDFKRKQKYGQTLLEIGANSLNKESLDFILHSGGDPREKDEKGRSAVFGAVCSTSQHGSADEIERIKLLAKYDPLGLKTVDDEGMTLLHYAASCANLNVIQFLLKQGLKPSVKDQSGYSPLHRAVSGSMNIDSKIEVVELLLKESGDARRAANEALLDGTTPLMSAARDYSSSDTQSIVELLVKAGADPNARDKRGRTPLHEAVLSGSVEGVKSFLELGARLDGKDLQTLLMEALRSRKPDMLKLIVSRGSIDLEARDDEGYTLLMRSVYLQDFGMAKTLIELGAKVDIKMPLINGSARTFLSFAVANTASPRFVRLLHEAGAKFESKQEYLEALDMAAYNADLFECLVENFREYNLTREELSRYLVRSAQNPVILKYIFERGVEASDPNAMKSLVEASKAGAAESIKLLLDKGVPPLDYHSTPLVFLAAASSRSDAVHVLLNDKKFLTARDSQGRTILSWAVPSGNLDLVKDLVRQGADLKAKESDGETLLFRAVQGQSLEMMDYLIQNKLDPNALVSKTRDYVVGQSPLHVAARLGDLKGLMLAALVKAGTDINLKDAEGDTPLHVALLYGQFQQALKLIELGANLSITNNDGLSPEMIIRRSNDPLLFAALQVMDRKKIEALKKRWNEWVKNPRSSLAEPELIESLLLSVGERKFPEEPRKDAPEKLKKIYKSLKAARFTPEMLKGDSLEIEDVPVGYYREILRGASTIRAQSASQNGQPYVFNPKPEQVKKVLNIMLSDPKASEKDLESLAWLLVRSGIKLDADILDQFKIDQGKLQADVDQMLLSQPFQYKGSSSFAAIKLIKSLLSYSDEKFACAEGMDGAGGSAVESQISRILNWFGNYGNNPDADRVFFAKLARLVLEKKKICSRDRDILINAMRDWKGTNAMVQNEIACAVAQSLGSAPLSGREIEEFTIISETVGLRSELNQGSWLEQMKAFGQLLAHHGGGELSGDEQEVYNGLLKFVLGTPEGVVKRKVGGEEKKFFSFPKSEANAGQVVKLCKILKRMGKDKAHLSESEMSLASGASLWLQLTRERLDSARKWPEGFEAPGFDMRQTIREEMRGEPKLAADLVALETSCEIVPGGDGTPESYTERQSRNKARQRPRTRTKKGNFDFSPN